MTTWTFDAVDLSTFGQITELNDYLDTAEKRGGDQTVPNIHGSIFVEKFFSEGEISFGIAILKDNAIALEAAFDELKALLSSRTQKYLENTRADGSVRKVLASHEGKMQVKRESYKFARVVITFKLAEPFFRATSQTVVSEVVDASPTTLDITNPGSVEECNPIIELTGPLEDTVITNTTNGVVLTYTGVIPSPRIVTLQKVGHEYIATNDLGTNVIANFSHQGREAFMVLDPGLNELSITDDNATTGEVQISFYAPYL